MGVLVRILGRTGLEVDGVAVDLSGQQACALAVLAARAPALVSRDALVDALWGERPPPSASNAVQVRLSGLRKAVAATGWEQPFILGDRVGYRLADPVEVDVALLRRALAAAHSGLSEDTLATRLARWDELRVASADAPLTDLEDVASLLEVRAELASLARQAKEQRWSDLLAAGRAAQVATDLTPVVLADPADASGTALLARAHYLLGRQVDALSVLAAHRTTMSSEFGLDPSTAMVELERKVLLQDPELFHGPATTPSAPRSTPALDADGDEPLGRDDLIERIMRMLDSDPQLITLVGPGGIGKTTVATTIARRLQHHETARPVILVAAAGWPPDADVLTGFAHTVMPPDDVAAYAHAIEAVRAMSAVVILDNLEHLTHAPEHVARLVEDLGTPIVATSRRPLDIPAEQLVRVPALDVGASGPAVALFLAAAERAGCSPTTSGLPSLAELVVDHVGGLPLGIELAASWLRVLDADALRDKLGLSVYATTAQTVPARQRSLALLIDDAVHLVEPSAARLFEWLSLCPDGARLPIVEALLTLDAPPPDGDGSPGALGALCDAGLIRPTDDPDGAKRYLLLPVVRERAAQRLEQREPAALSAGRSAWATATAEAARDLSNRVRSADGLTARQVLRTEFASIAAALHVLTANGGAELALSTASQLRNFAELESRVADVCQLIEAALGSKDVAVDSRVRALNALALLYPHLNKPEEAQRAAETALELALTIGDPVLTGRTHTTVAGLLIDDSRMKDAEPHLDAAEALRLADGDTIGVSLVRSHRGIALLREGRLDAASDALRAVLDVPGIEQYPDVVATARYNIALAAAVGKDPAKAALLLLDVLDEAIAIDEHELVAYVAVAAAVGSRWADARSSALMAGLAMTALRRLDEELEGTEAEALDDAVGVARNALGDAAFARAFAEGAAIPEHAVVARISTELNALLTLT